MNKLFDLTSKTAVITGGGGILCSGIARHLAASGVKVAILDLDVDAAEKVADSITKAGGKTVAIPADVINRKS
ncbi:MAG: SDR family NAD(P)-dependent oxidoreductase, partial [Planctomycetota bacterium]